MMMDEMFSQAERSIAEIRDALSTVEQQRQRICGALAEYELHWATFEERLAEGKAGGTSFRAVYPGLTGVLWEGEFSPGQRWELLGARNRFHDLVIPLRRIAARCDRKIATLKERLFEAEFWLEEKRETWGKIDPELLKSQIREILLAGEELSMFLLGRNVEVVFDTRDEAPLGSVPIYKSKLQPRKVHLSADLLGRQPRNVTDCYRALLVHELGHLLLHLKESNRNYRRLQRLLKRKISVAPDFFSVLNILLDEQLERVLRDTRAEWKGWFNRLDFLARRCPLRDFRKVLVSSGIDDPKSYVKELAAKRLIKCYTDPVAPFCTVQSASLFSLGLKFTRLYTFFVVVRHQLPRATIEEEWLHRCLACIPPNFKSLDIFEIHAVAAEIYKILTEERSEGDWHKVRVDLGGGRFVDLDMPGRWNNQKGHKTIVLWPAGRPVKRHQTVAPEPPLNALSSADSEGDPPPPPSPPPPAPEPEPQSSWWPSSLPPIDAPVVESVGRRRTSPMKMDQKPRRVKELPPQPKRSVWMPPVDSPSTVSENAGQSKSDSNSPRKKLLARQRSQHLSSKEKVRLRREAREQARVEAEQKQQAATEKPAECPQSVSKPVDRIAPQVDVGQSERLLAEAMPSGPQKSGSSTINEAMQVLVDQVRREMAGTPGNDQDVDQIVAFEGQAADFKNQSDTREFPELVSKLRLTGDADRQRHLTRNLRPLIHELRQYFIVSEQESFLEERLMGGRRLLGGGLAKYVAYGERRMFADFRVDQAENQRELLVAVLVDTSASMKTDGRLDRAVALAMVVAECLRTCTNVKSIFLGYNQNVYLCGDHEHHSLDKLRPAGKTNEAAALAYLRETQLSQQCRKKVVLVISDGLPTACSVESVCWQVTRQQRELGIRFLYGAVSEEPHPAYAQRIDLTQPLTRGTVRSFGKRLQSMIRR